MRNVFQRKQSVGCQGKQNKTPSKHSTPEAPHGKEPDREREAGSHKIRQQEGWVRSVLTMLLQVPLKSLVLKGGSCCHLQIEN